MDLRVEAVHHYYPVEGSASDAEMAQPMKPGPAGDKDSSAGARGFQKKSAETFRCGAFTCRKVRAR